MVHALVSKKTDVEEKETEEEKEEAKQIWVRSTSLHRRSRLLPTADRLNANLPAILMPRWVTHFFRFSLCHYCHLATA